MKRRLPLSSLPTGTLRGAADAPPCPAARPVRAGWRLPAAARDRVLSLAALLLLWWAAAWFAASPQLLPSPAAVLDVAWQQIQTGEMPRNFAATLMRVAAAFALSMVIGSALGYAAGRSARLNALLDPWLIIFLNLPLLVVVLLVFIWLGLNELAAVVAVTIAKAPTIMVTMREGTRALDPALEELSTVYRVPRARHLRRVVMPQLAPYLAAAGRAGLSVTWKIVLVVELLGRPNGVGFELNLFFQSFDVAGILAYGVCFGAVMLLIETALLQPWERHANAWRRRA